MKKKLKTFLNKIDWNVPLNINNHWEIIRIWGNENYLIWLEKFNEEYKIFIEGSNNKYKIKSLKWKKYKWEKNYYIADVLIGDYKVYKINNQWYWGFFYDENFNECCIKCNSLKEGKQKAKEHWLNLLETYLEEIN